MKLRLFSVFPLFMVSPISADLHEWSSGRICDLHGPLDIIGIWSSQASEMPSCGAFITLSPGQAIIRAFRYFRDPVSERNRETEVDPVARRRMKQKEGRRLRETRELRRFLQFNSIGLISVASRLLARHYEEQKEHCPSCLRKGKWE